jgi:hypothetical protein
MSLVFTGSTLTGVTEFVGETIVTGPFTVNFLPIIRVAHRNRDYFVTHRNADVHQDRDTPGRPPGNARPGRHTQLDSLMSSIFVEAGLRRRAGDPCGEPNGYVVAGSSRD